MESVLGRATVVVYKVGVLPISRGSRADRANGKRGRMMLQSIAISLVAFATLGNAINIMLILKRLEKLERRVQIYDQIFLRSVRPGD